MPRSKLKIGDLVAYKGSTRRVIAIKKGCQHVNETDGIYTHILYLQGVDGFLGNPKPVSENECVRIIG